MRRLKCLALAVAMLGQSSFAMEEPMWDERDGRLSEHVQCIRVDNWGEVQGLAEAFANHCASRGPALLLSDFDQVIANQDGQLMDAYAPAVIRELEDSGFRIAIMTGRCSLHERIRVSAFLQHFRIGFRPIFLNEGDISADGEEVTSGITARLCEAWRRGVRIDCDPANGVFYVGCFPMTMPDCVRFLGIDAHAQFTLDADDHDAVERISTLGQNAVLYCDKGVALRTSIELGLIPRPEVLVFVDDQPRYLLPMGEICESMGIRCLLLHCASAEEAEAAITARIAALHVYSMTLQR